MSFFSSFTGGAQNGAARDSSTAQWSALQDALNGYRSGAAQGRSDLQNVRDTFSPLYNAGIQQFAGLPMYQNALGLNGQQGTQAAQSAFTAGPGYQWQQDQAGQQLSRQLNASGGGASNLSGNVMSALQNQSQGLAGQEWNNWINQLAGLDTRMRQGGTALALGGAQGIGNAWTGMGNMGMQEAQLEGQANMGTAGQIAQNAMRAGQSADQGNANMWSAAINSLKSMAGYPGGGQGMLSGIGSFFGV